MRLEVSSPPMSTAALCCHCHHHITPQTLLDCYKGLKSIDQNELVMPAIKITTKILNYKATLEAVSAFMPNRVDGADSLPEELHHP